MKPVALIVATILLKQLSIAVILAQRIHSTDIRADRVNPHMDRQNHLRSSLTLGEILSYNLCIKRIQRGGEIIRLLAILCADNHHTILLLHHITLHAHRLGRGILRFFHPGIVTGTEFQTQRHISSDICQSLGYRIERILGMVHILTCTCHHIKAALRHIMSADIVVGMLFLLINVYEFLLNPCLLTGYDVMQLLAACPA